MKEQDVPSPIDFRDPVDAQQWEATAQDRPGRLEMFQAFAAELRGISNSRLDVLELGSGPGFLAAYLLQEMLQIRMTLLDYSDAMHNLARKRLGKDVDRVHFAKRDFKESGWKQGLGMFDAVITNQAVHELQHKKYAVGLHSMVKGLLRPGGTYLVSDHFFGEGGLQNDQLYMTITDQQETLRKAGFAAVCQVAAAGSLVMHRAI